MSLSRPSPTALDAKHKALETKRKLSEWFDFIQLLHGRSIDLTLDRVKELSDRLAYSSPPFKVISVAGTNGKGSVATMVESMLRSAGYRTGLYTSPHLIRFNERFKVNGNPICDDDLLSEYEFVEDARDSVPLTFFEFGTMIALDYFYRSQVDVAVMEIGLGGRLDAVNVLDADVACITSIGTDHGKWLGANREQIGFEKAGILRREQLAVCTDVNPPQSVLDRAGELSAKLHVGGRDFFHHDTGDSWMWQLQTSEQKVDLENLPKPPLRGMFQFDNCAGAVAVAVLARSFLKIPDQAIRDGIVSASIEGRLQVAQRHPEVLLDVAHNAEAAKALGEYLKSHPIEGRSIAVMSALSEKPVESMVDSVSAHFDEWHLCGIEQTDRGWSVEDLAERVVPVLPESDQVSLHKDAHSAFDAAMRRAKKCDRIVAFGSFFVVGDIIARYQ